VFAYQHASLYAFKLQISVHDLYWQADVPQKCPKQSRVINFTTAATRTAWPSIFADCILLVLLVSAFNCVALSKSTLCSRQSSANLAPPHLPRAFLYRIRTELDAQTASLRAVLEEQNQQLRAAKEHGVQMEEQAGSAQAQVRGGVYFWGSQLLLHQTDLYCDRDCIPRITGHIT
jgi:hypothetical protein